MAAARRRWAARPPPPRRARTAAQPNPAGAHYLADQVARRLVQQAGIDSADLVLDLGAGHGALTRPLARTGARIIAVERDGEVAARLTAAFDHHPNVTVLVGDVLETPLPHRRYRVVANIPFGITSDLLRRLLASRLHAADLVVELAAGRRLAATRPGRPETLLWQAHFRFESGPVVPAHRFRPAPSVDAVVLRLRRHPQPPPPDLAAAIRYAYRTPGAPAGRVLGRAAVRRAGIDPGTSVRWLTAGQWRSVLPAQLATGSAAASRPSTRRSAQST